MTPRPGDECIRDEDVTSTIEREGNSIALILLGGVNYATGQAFDMAAIARSGQARGCVVGYDLAHAAGNLILKLHEWGPDFAVWCGYKYLNGGPGCAGGCFVHERHSNAWNLPRFAGWWGHDAQTRFEMGPDFQPMAGAEGWQLSNPPILALAALRASMEIFSEVGMDRVRERSLSLTGYLEFLLGRHSSPIFSIMSPREPERRGAQLSLRILRHGQSLCERLAARGVIADWRQPDILRIAPVPLYNSYLDVYRFVQRFTASLS
jgi:kynureninase